MIWTEIGMRPNCGGLTGLNLFRLHHARPTYRRPKLFLRLTHTLSRQLTSLSAESTMPLPPPRQQGPTVWQKRRLRIHFH